MAAASRRVAAIAPISTERLVGGVLGVAKLPHPLKRVENPRVRGKAPLADVGRDLYKDG
jgi:hypothetical protein